MTKEPAEGEAGGQVATELADTQRWLEAHRVNVSGLTLDGIVGHREAKRQLAAVAYSLRHPESITDAGGRLPRGILVHGDPGIGKTLWARTLAALITEDADPPIPFYELGAGEVVGEQVIQLGRWARSLRRRAVVYLDECDLWAIDRGSERHTQETRAALMAMLSILDGIHGGDQVLWIASSNTKPDWLDQALVRPGRFGLWVGLRAPKLEDRTELLRRYVAARATVGPIDTMWAAEQTSGWTGAALEQLADDALALAKSDGLDGIDHAHLREAIGRAGQVQDDRTFAEEDHWRTCVHEAGHALVGVLEFGPGELQLVVADGWNQAKTGIGREDTAGVETRSEMLADAAVALAGAITEEVVLGDTGSGGLKDTERGTSALRDYILSGGDPGWGFLNWRGLEVGYTGERGPRMTDAMNDRLRMLLTERADYCRRLVEEHRQQLTRFAAILRDERRLSGGGLRAALVESGIIAAWERRGAPGLA